MKLEEEFTLDYDNCYTYRFRSWKCKFYISRFKNKILNNINLNIDQGERIFIDGANGSERQPWYAYCQD
jgi:ABC-type polysaccharide/polyol phosphate transport system ATPase subunit